MTTLPATITLRQRLFALAAATAITASLCAANLGIAQGYASRDTGELAQAGTSVHTADRANTPQAAERS